MFTAIKTVAFNREKASIHDEEDIAQWQCLGAATIDNHYIAIRSKFACITCNQLIMLL